MSEDTKNLYLAIALSILVILGWSYFFAPQLQKGHQTQEQMQQPSTAPQPGAPAAQPAPNPNAAPPQGGAIPEVRPRP